MPIYILENNEWKEIDEEKKKNLPDEEKKKTLSIPSKLKQKLDFAIRQINNNNDVVGIIVGDEGSGKSSLAGNLMRYVTKDNFDPKKDIIGSDYEEGIEKIQNAKEKGALMFDEGNVFFLSTETMKKEHRNLHKIFSIFRQKCLFTLIVLPSFFRLGTYFAIDRSDFLIRTYIKKGERGFFEYYGKALKADLYKKGKKNFDYKVVSPKFKGRFTKCHILENEDYKKFKLKTLMDSISVAKKKKEKTPYQIEIEFRNKIIKNNLDKTARELAKILGITEQRVGQLKKRFKKELSLAQKTPQMNDLLPKGS